MKFKYFLETNTAHVEFKDNVVRETKEISENIYIDIDSKGNLVGMAIGHTKSNADLWEFSLQEMPQQTA